MVRRGYRLVIRAVILGHIKERYDAVGVPSWTRGRSTSKNGEVTPCGAPLDNVHRERRIVHPGGDRC